MRHSVILLSSEYPPHICGGLGTHVASLTAAMAPPIEFHILVPASAEYSNANPAIHLHPVPLADARNNMEFWVEFCRSCMEIAAGLPGPVSLIHCHEWMTLLAGIGLKARLGAPLVYNVHLPQDSGPTLQFENLGLACADLVLVNSHAVERELQERGVDAGQITVVPNGVDTALFQPSQVWPEDAGYILFVGRLVPQKGLDVLLKAFAVLVRRCPESRLSIVGDGYLQLYLKRVARYLGIAGKISFIDWSTGPPLIRLYQDARFVIVPSYYEPFGIVALEAMACARPVIASRVGGLEEIVADGHEGWLVEAGDHLELAKRMAGLAADAAQRERMGRAGRLKAQAFDWKHVAERMITLYEGLIRTSPAPLLPEIVTPLKAKLIESLEARLRPLAARLLA